MTFVGDICPPWYILAGLLSFHANLYRGQMSGDGLCPTLAWWPSWRLVCVVL